MIIVLLLIFFSHFGFADRLEKLLLHAINFRDEHGVALLINKGASVNTVYDHGLTPLIAAASLLNNREIVMMLIKAGADVHKQTWGGESALHRAAKLPNNLSVLEELIRQDNRLVNLKSNRCLNRTPLHLAASVKDNAENILFLILEGADFQLPDLNGITPLHILHEQGYIFSSDFIKNFLQKDPA